MTEKKDRLRRKPKKKKAGALKTLFYLIAWAIIITVIVKSCTGESVPKAESPAYQKEMIANFVKEKYKIPHVKVENQALEIITYVNLTDKSGKTYEHTYRVMGILSDDSDLWLPFLALVAVDDPDKPGAYTVLQFRTQNAEIVYDEVMPYEDPDEN